MNTIIAKPKPKTQEWLKKAIQATGLTPAILITALLEQEAEKSPQQKEARSLMEEALIDEFIRLGWHEL